MTRGIKHWTQRPGAKAKIAAAVAKGVRTRKKNGKKQYLCKQCPEWFLNPQGLANHVRYAHPKEATRGSTEEVESDDDFTSEIQFLAGSISKEISYYALGTGVPRATLAKGVAAILRDQTMR